MMKLGSTGARREGQDVGRPVDCEETDGAGENQPRIRFQETSPQRGILGAQRARGRASDVQSLRESEVNLLLRRYWDDQTMPWI